MPAAVSTAADLAGARVVVAGARVTGVAAVQVLGEWGAEVTVTDAAPDQLRAVEHLEWGGRPVRTAIGLTALPAGTDLVVTSPGFRPDSPLMLAARDAGVPVIGDVALAHWVDRTRAEPADWLVVTGTNGKTTTVGMLAAILCAAGKDTVACGNIGLPVLDAVRSGHRVLAVELSSFQLHWSPDLAPRAAVVLNVSADHLDWHGSMDSYAAAKGHVYAEGTTAVVNRDDEWSRRLAAGRPGLGFSLDEPGAGDLGLAGAELVHNTGGVGAVLATLADVRPPGRHNVANALAAAALARAIGVSPEAVREGLRAFTPAGHRGAVVGEYAGVRFVDDSKATNAHAARAALLSCERVVWVAGGLLKGADVDDLVADVHHRLTGAVLMGTDRAIIAKALARHAPDLPVVIVDTGDDGAMTQVVAAAVDLADAGDVVLLAPAAASMDMFTDYAHRGRAFADAVRALTATGEDSGPPGGSVR